MNITLIAAMDKKRGIGYKNTIPWMGMIPSDMKHFKKTTTGHPVIMGKNTYLSMGRALPNRTNILLSRTLVDAPSDIHIFSSLDEGLSVAGNSPGSEEIFIIGGGQVYKEALPYANKIIISYVDGEFETDASFPDIDLHNWDVISDDQISSAHEDKYPVRVSVLKLKTTV